VQIAQSLGSIRRRKITAQSRPAKWRSVAISPEAVEMDSRFQPREGLHRSTVVKYLWDMRRGDSFPPIKLGRVNGKLVLLDGFHRVQAAREARVNSLRAEVAPMSEAAATQFAIAANANHGKRLTQKDKRRCFELYRDAGLHKHPDGTVKSLRTICRELSNIVVPNTIRNWLRQSDIEVVEDEDAPERHWDDEATDEVRIEDLDVQLHGVERTILAIDDDGLRALALGHLRDLLERLKVRDPLEI
jgi:hypothetical protein